MKQLTSEQCCLTDTQRRAVHAATTCDDLYAILQRDYWVVTPCHSRWKPGRTMEGTRLTLVTKGRQGYEFTIRTPGTPARWELFHEEFQHLWKDVEAVGAALQRQLERQRQLQLQQENVAVAVAVAVAVEVAVEVEGGIAESKRQLVDLALLFFFYWVNYAPLTRGSAATGYCVLFAVLMAAGYEVLPPGMALKGVQMDWEAILCSSPDEFVNKIKPWFTKHLHDRGIDRIPEQFPDVATHIPCAREMIKMLNLELE
jgi:hypothetical protein